MPAQTKTNRITQEDQEMEQMLTNSSNKGKCFYGIYLSTQRNKLLKIMTRLRLQTLRQIALCLRPYENVSSQLAQCSQVAHEFSYYILRLAKGPRGEVSEIVSRVLVAIFLAAIVYGLCVKILASINPKIQATYLRRVQSVAEYILPDVIQSKVIILVGEVVEYWFFILVLLVYIFCSWISKMDIEKKIYSSMNRLIQNNRL